MDLLLLGNPLRVQAHLAVYLDTNCFQLRLPNYRGKQSFVQTEGCFSASGIRSSATCSSHSLSLAFSIT